MNNRKSIKNDFPCSVVLTFDLFSDDLRRNSVYDFKHNLRLTRKAPSDANKA